MLKGLNLDDMGMYYRECFFKHEGRVGFLHEIRRGKTKGDYIFVMQDVSNGDSFEANTSELDFSFPDVGYIDLGERGGVCLVRRTVGRGYKKGVRTRDVKALAPVFDPTKANRAIRTMDTRNMYNLFYPKFFDTEHLSSKLGSKKANTRKVFPLSHNFCAVVAKKKPILAYNGFVVGDVVDDHVALHPGCEFLREKLMLEVQNVRLV
jgi:hypothetical protein